MKIKVHKEQLGRAVYEVNGVYYGFCDQAPRNQAEFEELLMPAARKSLAEGLFLESDYESEKLTFVCEVEA